MSASKDEGAAAARNQLEAAMSGSDEVLKVVPKKRVKNKTWKQCPRKARFEIRNGCQKRGSDGQKRSRKGKKMGRKGK